MSKNLTFIFFLALISAFSINSLEAQSKSEKKVTIVKKVIDKDGKETIERIEATGAEAEKYLQELESVEGESIDIDVNINGGDNNTSISQKKYKIKVLDEEGNEKVLEWNGEGDMPAEMQKVMKEHDIDSANLQDDSKEGKKIVKMKFIEEDGEVHDLESHGINVKRKEIMNADGSKTIEVEVEDMESAGAQTIEVEVSNSGMADEEIIVEVIEENNNKAQLGVMIENAPDGVTIKGFAPESNAKNGGLLEGDVITNFNGQNVRTIENLVSAVGKYDAGDKVQVKFRRNNEMLEKTIELTPRTGDVKKKFEWKQAGKQ